MEFLDIFMTPIGLLMIIIGPVIGFAASRFNKSLGTATGLFAGVLGSCSGGIGMFMWGVGKIRDGEVMLVLMLVGAVLGALIVVFGTYLFLLKNRSLANSPGVSQNFSETPISRFCTQCGNRLEAQLRFCPSCGSAAQE